MELIQLFKRMDMPRAIGKVDTTRIIRDSGSNCIDTYCRWYPNIEEKDRPYCFFVIKENIEARMLFNQWLVEHGMEWDKDHNDFYVLIQMW